MSENTPANFTCGACAFWSPFTQREGSCRRRAPRPVGVVDEVARWPRTQTDAFCGEGCTPSDTDLQLVTCATCVYWRRPSGGLQPVDLLDHLAAWWSRAGHCHRIAPLPSSASGYKAAWRATHETDSCFEGKKRSG